MGLLESVRGIFAGSAPQPVAESPSSPRELLEAKLTAFEDRQAMRLLESFDLLANYVDPRDAYAGPNGETWVPLGGGLDGRDASDRSYLANEMALQTARNQCRWLAFRNPYAINLHENMINYVVGENGHKYTIVAKQGKEISDDAKLSVQSTLDEWMYRNRWCQRQQESVRRLDRDGEMFYRRFKDERGIPSVRFVEPNQIKQPAGNTTDLFGIQTDPDDVEQVLGYWIDGELVDAEEIQHRKANVDCNVRRGIPTTYPIAELLQEAYGVLLNIGATSKIQTAIAMVRRHVNAGKSNVENMVANTASWTVQNKTTGKVENIAKYGRGTVIDAPASTEYDFPAAGLNVKNYVEGVQGILRGAASRVCFPEFMFTSDASNANYASTMVAEGPAVRMFQRRQANQKAWDLEIIWEVLGAMAEADVIDSGVLELIEVQVDCPTVQVRDELQEAQVNKIYADMRLLSPQTITASIGQDYEQQQKNIEEHEKKHPTPEDPNADPLMQASKKARESVWSKYGGPALLESEGVWRTINGVHVQIDKNGTVTKGPKDFVGKKPSELDDRRGDAHKDSAAPITKAEKFAIEDYTTDLFQEINGELRAGGELSPHVEKVVNKLDSALAKMPKYEKVTFRVIDRDADIVKQLESGSFSDPAYMSASKHLPIAQVHKGQIGLQIKGKSGVDISHISMNPDEGEVLFPRGTKFKVVKIQPTKGGGFGAILQEI